MERIREIALTPASFEYPPGFDPEARMESAFDLVNGDPIRVKIRFSASQARYVKERKWSPTQRIRDQADGSVILSMKTSGWGDVKRWVLSYGSEAEVLEPKKLRGEILEAARSILKRQGRSPGAGRPPSGGAAGGKKNRGKGGGASSPARRPAVSGAVFPTLRG